MKRTELELYLGKTVEITLFDGDVIKGELHKTREDAFRDNPNLYIPLNRYFLVSKGIGGFCGYEASCLFRCSHVKKLKEISLEGEYTPPGAEEDILFE